jgi:mannose-6-phosphate isomerase class I
MTPPKKHTQQLYPDAAHKPEMVISLSGFSGFAGFLAPQRMQQLLQDYPQLGEVLGANNVRQYLDALQAQDTQQRQLVSQQWLRSSNRCRSLCSF